MGCLKLAYYGENEPVLRCVWNAGKQAKIRVRLYDYGARFYDAQIGRFTIVDPMSEKFYDYSSYSYGQNNPIGSIDVGGHFVFKDASKYPELSRLLQNIHKVLDNPRIMSGLQKFSGLDPLVIRAQFQDNNGPIIRTADLQRFLDKPRVGQTIDDGTIELDNAMVMHLENALKEGNVEEYEEYLFYITLVILHEYNHSGDIQIHGTRFSDLGQPDENCLGYQFENETFGRKMKSPSDVRKYSEERSNYVEQKPSKKNGEFWNQVMNLGSGSYHIVNSQIVKD